MTWRELTVRLIVFWTIGIGIYDVFAAVYGGAGATVSEIVLEAAGKHPIIVVAFGVLVGHLFWPQRAPG